MITIIIFLIIDFHFSIMDITVLTKPSKSFYPINKK